MAEQNFSLARCLKSLAALAALTLPGFAASQPLMRYNAIIETTFLLDRCGVLTPERRAYLEKEARLARQPLDFTKEQWAAQDSALARDLPRLNPAVSKERCEELVSSIDQEMQTAPKK